MPTESTSIRQIPDGKHAEKKAIPRFVSFKPSIPLEIQSQGFRATERLPDDAPDDSRSEHYRQAPGQHHPRGHHDTNLKRGLNGHFRSEPTTQDSEAYGNLLKPFVVDRGGDVNNLKFGALHATTSYFRYGAGNVVGLPRNQRIDRAVSTDKGLVLSDNTRGLLTTRDKHTRWKLGQEGARELKIKLHEEHDLAVDSALDAADYVPLEATQRAKRRRGGDGLHVGYESSSDEYDTHYRSVEGQARFKKEPADQDLKYNSDTLSSQDIVGNELAKREQIRLSKRIDAEPTNSAAWIQLISHQDSMLGIGRDLTRMSLTNAERRSIAEIKLAIFEKALEKVNDSQGREVLLLGMMQEATRVWERDKISSRWKSILHEYSQSMRLWTKYLDFMQTSFTNFRFEKVQSAYRDCLNITRGARNGGEISADEQNKVFEIQIYVVLRMTLFMREGGFAEHATAAWQSLLEFAFFKPVVLQGGDQNKHRLSDEATSMFGNFWDSEVPRIGEEGAEGWANFFQKQGKPPRPRTETADDLNYGKNRWKSWLASERRCSLSSRNPARTIDDIERNDPYRVVLFSDIRLFLIDPPSPAGQQLILDAFVAFCYLPPFAAEGTESPLRIWGRDCFLRNDPLRLNSKLQELWELRSSKRHRSSEEQDSIEKGGSQLQSGTQDPLLLPVRDYQVSLDSLFAEKHWFSAFDIWQEQCSGDNGLVEAAWVLRSLKSLTNICVGGEAVALYILALELRISPGTVKRTAKNILRKRPFSIRLYNAYALVEYRLADVDKGEGIIATSINMGKKLDEVSQRDTVLLWRTWIWETLSAYSAREALERLLAFGDEEIQTPFLKVHPLDPSGSAQPALLLRTERVGVFLPSNRSSSHLTGSRCYTRSHAIFELIQSGNLCYGVLDFARISE